MLGYPTSKSQNNTHTAIKTAAVMPAMSNPCHDDRLNRNRDGGRVRGDAAVLRWNRCRPKTRPRHPAWNDGEAPGNRAAAGARAAEPAQAPRHTPELSRWLP